MITLIENAEVYTPDPIGRTSVLVDHDKIIKVGTVERRAVAARTKIAMHPFSPVARR